MCVINSKLSNVFLDCNKRIVDQEKRLLLDFMMTNTCDVHHNEGKCHRKTTKTLLCVFNSFCLVLMTLRNKLYCPILTG